MSVRSYANEPLGAVIRLHVPDVILSSVCPLPTAQPLVASARAIAFSDDVVPTVVVSMCAAGHVAVAWQSVSQLHEPVQAALVLQEHALPPAVPVPR